MDIAFTDYTAAAQSSLVNAAQEAATLRAPELEPEHLLLGLLTPASGAVWSWLTSIVGNPNALRMQVNIALANAPTADGVASPPLSYRTRRVVTEADEEAKRTRSLQIDTPHLLLGLLDEGGAAAQILRQRGLDARTLRFWLKQQPSGVTFGPATPPPPKVVPAKRHPELREDVSVWRALPRLISWPAVGLLLGVLILGGVLSLQDGTRQVGMIIFIFGGWIVSLCAHEFAHALAADLGGDRSVRMNGYLSFNPIKYTHIVMSIIMPLVFLMMGGIGLPGGAVYVDRSRLRGPKWDSIVSAAGPLASLLMAALCAIPFLLTPNDALLLSDMLGFWSALAAVALLNIAAVILNLLPIPPLDGFGIIAPWLNPNLRNTLYAFGSIGVILIFVLLSTNEAVNDIYWSGVYGLLETLNVSPLLANIGISQLLFWRR